MSSGRAGRGAHLGAVLFAVLLVLTIATFAVERAARSSDDVVNTVVLTPPSGSGAATVTFTLAEPDSDVDVLIIDGNEGSDGDVVATLAEGEALGAGSHSFEWDTRTDDGGWAPGGLYALEVVLGEQDRDVEPPGRIELPDRRFMNVRRDAEG